MSALGSVYVTVRRFLLAMHSYLSGLLLIFEAHVYTYNILYILFNLTSASMTICVLAYFFIDTKKQAEQLTGWYDI
jgi:hypothetical protein